MGRSACMSAGVVAFGFLATFRAQAAMAFSWPVSPASLPVRIPAPPRGLRLGSASRPTPVSSMSRVESGAGVEEVG